MVSETTFLKIITPTNLAEEKIKFFANKKYHPQFSYNWNKRVVANYLKTRQHRRKLIMAILGQDTVNIVREAKKVFQTKITTANVQIAKSFVVQKPTKRFQPNPEGFKKKFEKALKYFSINYQVVLLHEHGYNFRPNHKQKKLQVSKFGHRDFFSLDGSVKHEMVHVIRSVNGLKNKIDKSEDFLPTEEGLACYVQDYLGKYPKTSRFQHGAEYLATQVGLKGSLRDVYDFLRFLGFPKDLAWQRAVRHKFGFVDTFRPGDIIKPAMYFYHQQKIKSLSPDKIVRLFVGKIGVGDLRKYRKYTGLISEAKVRSFFGL